MVVQILAILFLETIQFRNEIREANFKRKKNTEEKRLGVSKRLLKYKPAAISSTYIYDMDIYRRIFPLYFSNVREPDKKRFTKAGSLVR